MAGLPRDGASRPAWGSKMTTRKTLYGSTAAFFVAGLLLSASALAAEPLKITKDQAKLVGIETATLSETAGIASQGFLARIAIPPQQVRYVGALAGGRVDNLMVVPGQAVRQGQLLAQITSPELLKTQLEFVQSISQEQFLRETLGREQALSQDRVVSPKQILATRNELSIATATTAERRLALQMSGMADQAIAALANSRVPTGSATIQSPIDGTVLEIAAVAGQSVEGPAAQFKIAQLATLWLEMQVPAAQLGRVALGSEVTVPGIGAKGTVTAIGGAIDGGNQAIVVRAEIANQDGKLRPGQFVEARVPAPAAGQNFWSVPSGSIVRMGSETYLLKEIDTGYQPVPVNVQYESIDVVTVAGELKGEDRIAVRGLVALKGAMRGLGGGE